MAFASSSSRNALGLALIASLSIGVAVMTACAAPAIQDDFVEPETQSPVKKPAPPPDDTTTKGADASVPDAAPECKTAPPNNKCGLDPQCGCGTNETCDVTNVSTGATSCVTGGGATLGRPCTQTGDCLAGLTCAYGACRPYCGTARAKCSTAGTDLCVESVGEDGKPVTNRNVCTINCDPRNPSAVCGTNACHWFATYYAPNKVSDCNFGGTTPPYSAACIDDTDCQPGFACIDHPSNQIGLECERWCRIGVAGDCPTTPKNLKCRDVFAANAPVINGEKLGICQDD